MQTCLWTVLYLSVFHSFVSCLHFDVEDTEVKCFIEEIPADTRVDVKFQATNLPQNVPFVVFVTVKNPEDKVLLSKPYGTMGSATFTSNRAGRHQICLVPRSAQLPPAGGSLMLHLDIRVGEQTNNYTDIHTRDKLTELQLRVRQLTEQVWHIQRELDYKRLRDEHFREIDHSTNMWIFWWPIIRSLYVVAAIMWSTKSW